MLTNLLLYMYLYWCRNVKLFYLLKRLMCSRKEAFKF